MTRRLQLGGRVERYRADVGVLEVYGKHKLRAGHTADGRNRSDRDRVIPNVAAGTHVIFPSVGLSEDLSADTGNQYPIHFSSESVTEMHMGS